jgi:hypothetical protein
MVGVVSGDAILTGVVALAGAVVGAAGTWLTGWLTSRSQNQQARDADKRQVYANFLASCEKMIRPIRDCQASPNPKNESERAAANDAMLVALSELKLIDVFSATFR